MRGIAKGTSLICIKPVVAWIPLQKMKHSDSVVLLYLTVWETVLLFCLKTLLVQKVQYLKLGHTKSFCIYILSIVVGTFTFQCIRK